MNLFERYLTLWVFLCIAAGVVLGQMIPAPFHWLRVSWILCKRVFLTLRHPILKLDIKPI